MTHNGPQRHETARVGADTHPHPLGALRATCAFLAGVLLNVTATVCMVAYSEACRRREVERESIRRRLVVGKRAHGGPVGGAATPIRLSEGWYSVSPEMKVAWGPMLDKINEGWDR